jgi:transcriptional regulator with XRE-family HTH domain
LPKRTTTDPVAAAFGEAVRAARTGRGLTVEAVAHELPRMDAAYLAAIERGAHAVTLPTAVRIASALGVPVSDLVRTLDDLAGRDR